MSDPTRPADPTAASVHPLRHTGFWLEELPFSIVLILMVAGVAYTSFSRQPIVAYWEILAPVIGLLCISAGWRNATASNTRTRLIVMQLLHWLAFLLVMNILLLPSVQVPFSAAATGLAVFTLLALGTFTAGIGTLSWHVCLLGLIMALCIPAIAWIENSALIIVLVLATAAVIAAVIGWYWHRWRRTAPQSPAKSAAISP
ncbi:MAG TPA: hypothetical protein VIJ52_02695 [Pseudolabrys sp.]